MKWLHPLVLLPAIKFVIQVAAIPGYGVFRDEFYYIACSERLALGYVDHPPLSIFILRGIREVFGDGIWPMRVTVAVAGAVLVLLVGVITQRLGGSNRAQWLAMTAFLAIPSFWFTGHYYSMNAFDTLFWATTGLIVVELSRRALDRPSAWTALGLVLGVGLLNKLSILWLGLGLGVGILATRRQSLATPGPWLAAGIAGLLVLPHVAWQWTTNWPTLEFIANATSKKMVALSPFAFLRGQVDLVGGLLGTAFVLAGALIFFGSEAGRRYRILVWIYVSVFLLLMLNGASRSGYLAPAYSWMFAAAGCGLESLVRGRRWRSSIIAGLGFLFLIRGVVALPFALPILAVEDFISYSAKLGVVPSTEERKELSRLPQHYADMFGWRDKVELARAAFEDLSPPDRERACFLTFNYGVAGALENEALVLGKRLEPALPPVLSGHNNYWLWGPGSCTGEVVIVMGSDQASLRRTFASVERAGTVKCTYCMPYENHQPVFVARGLLAPIEDAWLKMKHYD